METAITVSRRTRHNQRRTAMMPVISDASRPSDKAKRHTPTAVIPILVLAYIFNGSHDPKKVHWLNFVLSAVFYVAGAILNPDFLSLGAMFFAIALTNIACVWIVQNYANCMWSPAVAEILAQLHDSVRIYVKG